jgi:hypothetical protein
VSFGKQARASLINSDMTNAGADVPPFPPIEAYVEASHPAGKKLDSGVPTTEIKAFAFRSLDDIETSAEPEIVQGIYGHGAVIAVVGAPNAGKTALGVDHGLAVAANSTWFGLKVNGGPVIYFAPEAPASVIMRAKAAKARKFPDMRLSTSSKAHRPLAANRQASSTVSASSKRSARLGRSKAPASSSSRSTRWLAASVTVTRMVTA